MTVNKKLPPTQDENEVRRRMLHTPPTPHKPMKEGPAPAMRAPKTWAAR